MGKVGYNFILIKDMLKLLYPDEHENDIAKKYNNFYNRKTLIDKLDYVTNNMDKVFEKSNEVHKNYLYFLLNIRLKEIYNRIGEYDIALNINKEAISKHLKKLIDGASTLTGPDVPLIIIEAFLRLKVNRKLDEEIYQALRLFCPYSIDLINSFPCSYYVYSDGEMVYEIGYNEEQLLEVMVSLCENMTEHKEYDELQYMVLFTLDLMIETYNCFTDNDNVNEMSLELYTLLEKLQKCCLNKPFTIGKIFDVYKSFCDIIVKERMESQSNLLKKEDITDIATNFREFIQNLNEVQCRDYKKELNKLIFAFLGLKSSVEEDDELYFMETLQKLKTEPNLQKYVKEFIEESLLNTWYVSDLFKMREFKKISEIYYKFNDSERIYGSKFEYAYSLSECGDNEEAEKLYLSMINENKAYEGVYNNFKGHVKLQ